MPTRRTPTRRSSTNRVFGYARVSTLEQDPALQHDALAAAGADRVFTDRMSGASTSRPELDRLLEHLREGDTLVVWRLDRLGRSMPHLIATITEMGEWSPGLIDVARRESHASHGPCARVIA